MERSHKAYVCIEVFNREKPVLLVSREDGDWSLLCGGDHPDDVAYCKVVGIGHLMVHDPSLREILDLKANEEAERDAIGKPWIRSILETPRLP